MASSETETEIEIESDSETESETAVAEPALVTYFAVTIDNVVTASECGDFETLRKFVEQDSACLSSPGDCGHYALQWAARYNRSQIVQYIIQHGGDVNAVDNIQQTALHWAAYEGSISAADLLLQNGVNVEAADVNGDRAVHIASQNGQTSFLNQIVATYNANIDVPNNNGQNPLYQAAFNNHHETVQFIIEHGGDLNDVGNSQEIALHFAACNGSISVVDVLLLNGAQIEAVDVNGLTPVHIAAENGQITFLNHIVSKYKADLEVPDNGGKRPLHRAVINNHHEVVQYIIEHGGDVNAVDNDQWTALHFSANRGSISTADVLLLNGAKVEAADMEGNTAVHIAAQNGQTSFLNHIVTKYNLYYDVPKNDGERPLHGAAINNHPETVQHIIAHGGDVNTVDNNQRTALHFSAMVGSISVADVLLQNGALVDVADVDGNRAVHFAALKGHTSFLNHIVSKHNANFDVPNNEGKTPLHWAVINNHHEIVQYIIEHGGNVNAINNKQQTELHFSAKIGSISVADVLLQKGAHVEAADANGLRAVHIAAQHGQTSFLNHIVAKYNANFDVPNYGGERPLHCAIIHNHPEIIQYIIELGVDVNAVNNDKQTALHCAAVEGSILIADMLLKNKAQVEATDVYGDRAVHIASQNGQTSFLNHIVAKYNAHLDVPNNNGERPLHQAALNDYPETVQCIIEHGGDVNAVDNSQGTSLHISAMIGSISVADVLLQNGAQVEAADVDGNRAVHFAALKGQRTFLNHIVAKHNADFDVPNNEGMSPLHKAACEGLVDIVKWLLSKDASQKRQDIFGRTPLHWAAFQNQLEVCKVLIDGGTEQDIMVKDNEGNTAIELAYVDSHVDALFLSRALQAECKHLQHLNFKGTDMPKGSNLPMIIAMQGDAYTGKSLLAMNLALKLKCTIISLDDFLVSSEPTDEKDRLISRIFNHIAQIVKTQISLGQSVVVDSPLSRRSHLQKLVALVSIENAFKTRLVIIECKPENEYAYQLRFEESGSLIYANSWYKPTTAWPLPKILRDYTDDDIPSGVSKLVFDTNDHYSSCRLLEAVFDVVSCGYGHKTKYNDYEQFIHTDKEEQFTCPCSGCIEKKTNTNLNVNLHVFAFDDEGWDDWDTVCGVCDNQVHGSVYTCQDCPLALHESCAELARDEKKHFVPESFPIFLPREPDWRYTFPIERPCAECRKDGNGFSCKCKHCLFESHLKSRLVPTIVRHKNNDDLVLWLNSDVDGSIKEYTCLACRKKGQFAAYVYGYSNLYHPKCALLPPSVHHSHGGYTHDLEMINHRVEKEEDYICDLCPNKMDPTAWYYYCCECNISLHLDCAFLDFD